MIRLLHSIWPAIPFVYGLAALLVTLAGIVVGSIVYEQASRHEQQELQHKVEQILISLNNDLRNEISKHYIALHSLANLLSHPDLLSSEQQSQWQGLMHHKVERHSQQKLIEFNNVYFISHHTSKNGVTECIFENNFLKSNKLEANIKLRRAISQKSVDLCRAPRARSIFSRVKRQKTPLLIALEELVFPAILQDNHLPNRVKEYALIYPFYNSNDTIAGWLIGVLDKAFIEKRLKARRVFDANIAIFDITSDSLELLGESNTNASSTLPITMVMLDDGILRTTHVLPSDARLISQHQMEVNYLRGTRHIVESQSSIAGRRLLITINMRNNYGIYPVFIAVTVLLLFFVVSLIIIAQARVRNQAEKMAINMTKQLHVSEDRLKAAMDGSNDGIWDWDIINDTVWFSRRYYEILGYEDEGFSPNQQAFKSRVHPEDLHIVASSLKEHFNNGTVYAPIFRMKHKQGHYIWIHSRGQARILNGKAVRMAGVHTDITSEKSRELELFKAHQKAESAAEVKAQFLANMSHEIRTPLSGIVGIGDLLSQTPLNSKQHQYVGVLQDSCQTLLQIVNDILDYSKLEARKMSIEHIVFSLPGAVENCLALVLPETEKRDTLELIYRYSPSLPHHFISDPTRIRQILINLLSNAVKFTEEGYVFVDIDGSPSVDNPNIYDITLTVKDTGIGMDKSVDKNLFDKFTQADDSITRKYGGTGLGLSIIRELTKLLDGEVLLDSQINQGTTFTVQLSLQLATQEESDTPDLKNIADSRILMVEEQPIVIDLIKEALERHGAYVDGCTSPSEAIQMMEEQKKQGYPYSAVIMNHTMAPISGPELALEIRQNPMLEDTHMLLITSQSRRGDGKKMQALGFEAYLAKPIVAEPLCFAMDKILFAAKNNEAPVFITRHSYAEEKREKSVTEIDTPTDSLFYSPTILVVEDNPTNQRVIAWLLDDIGCHYVIAENGKEALETLNRTPNISLVLMDCHMPIMDGLTATKAIRACDNHFADIPIIALSANNRPTDHEECLNAGMNAFFSKPIERYQLLELINQYAPNITPAAKTLESKPHQTIDHSEHSKIVDSMNLNTKKLLDLTSGSHSLTKRFLDMFDESVQTSIQEMEVALKANDMKSLQRHAHTLKGAAANLHAETLRALASDIEQNAKSGLSENAAAIIPAIRSAYQLFQNEAKILLENMHDD